MTITEKDAVNLKPVCLLLVVGLSLSTVVYGITFATENRGAEIILMDGIPRAS